MESGEVVPTCHPSGWGAEDGESWVQGQSGLYNETTINKQQTSIAANMGCWVRRGMGRRMNRRESKDGDVTWESSHIICLRVFTTTCWNVSQGPLSEHGYNWPGGGPQPQCFVREPRDWKPRAQSKAIAAVLFLGGFGGEVLGLELRTLCLLRRCATAWVTPPALFCDGYFWD
jgi:hypothetical protein